MPRPVNTHKAFFRQLDRVYGARARLKAQDRALLAETMPDIPQSRKHPMPAKATTLAEAQALQDAKRYKS